MSALAETNGSELTAAVAELRAEIAELRSPRIEISREPRTYEARLVKGSSRDPGGMHAISPPGRVRSYVQDLVLAEHKGDEAARARLLRHQREVEVDRQRREAMFSPDVTVEYEKRAVSWTAGSGGYSAPPMWMIEYFAIVPTPERVLARLAPQFELPVGGQSINVPGWTAGADMGAQQLDVPVTTTDILDQAISSPVVTIAGNADVPLQMLEQSPVGAHLDWAVFTNMEARYGYRLEQQMLQGQGPVGLGTGGDLHNDTNTVGNDQLLGLLNNTQIPTANFVNYTGAGEGSASGATAMYTDLGLVMAKVGQNRFLPPENWLMSTSRVAWLGSSEDQQNRPLMITDSDGSGNFDLLTVSVAINDAIPRNVGGSAAPVTYTGTQEPIICLRPSDWLVLESERRTSVYVDTLSGTLQARLQMRRYAAALLRQPTSVGVLVGSGMNVGGGF